MKCGCKITCRFDGVGQSEYDGEIVFCPLHAAAEEMLEILVDAIENRPTTKPWMRKAIEARAKAEGRHE